jgi:hypothetical protein
MWMKEQDLNDKILSAQVLQLDDAAKKTFRAALQEFRAALEELKGGRNWQETAAYAAEKARQQLEVMLPRSEAELQIAHAELELHKARSDRQLQLHTAHSDREMRALKAELSKAKHVATLLESRVGKEANVMAKVAATMKSDRERRGSVKAWEELESLSGKDNLQAKKRRAFLKTRASRRFISTDKVTQEDVQSTTGRLTSLGSLTEVIDEQDPELELEPEPEPESEPGPGPGPEPELEPDMSDSD